MSEAAKTLRLFAIYLFFSGLFLMVRPSTVLQMLGFVPANEIWVRISGLLLFLFGFYYVRAAYSEVAEFFMWSVQARVLVFVFFLGVTVLGISPPVLLLMGIIDLAGAIWTWKALRSRRVVD